MRFTSILLAAATAALSSAQDIPTLEAALNSTESLSTLNTLLASYPDLLATLANSTNITIFAPSNDALETLMSAPGFEELAATPGFIEAVLQYHVVNASISSANFTSTPLFVPTLQDNATYTNVSGGQRIGLVLTGEDDDAAPQVLSGLGQYVNVTEPDVMVSTGYVHIIDGVLTVPLNVSATALAANLTGLVGALDFANLTETVDTAEDITIFAPTTEAFEDIASALELLTAEQVASILQYHVVAGQVGYSSSLENGTQLEAMNGDQLNITIDEGELFVNSARVIAANILVSGGVVHLIDAVLNPNSTNTPNPDDDESSPVNFPDVTTGFVPFTSDLPTATVTAMITTTAVVLPSDYTTPQDESATATIGNTDTMTDGAALPTGMVGAAALFGGAALLANF